ncbi:MAG: helix-turn-helix transcriptional regulator [Candidatus Edwardsbacteria bacterium]
MDILTQIGKQIRTIRKEAKKTQADLAEATGLSDNYIALLERGKRSASIETLEKIAKALDVPLGELFIHRKERKAEVSRKKLTERLLEIFKKETPEKISLLVEIDKALQKFEVKTKTK